MNTLSRTEFRPMSDRQAQARLERMLASRRAAEAAREARFRTLPTPATVAPTADDDSPLLAGCLEVLAGLLLWALFGWGVIALLAWWLS